MVDFRGVYFAILLAVLSSANALLFDDHWDDLTDYYSQQCEVPYTTLNASGTFPIDAFGFLTDGTVAWEVAVSQPYTDGIGATNYSLYLSTPPGFDFRSGTLDYSACALTFEGISDNLIRRGQDDDGSCDQTFSESCVKALNNQAANTGYYLTSTFTNNSPAPGNLSAGSLPRVCNDIQQALMAPGAVPQDCAQFVGPSMTWYDGEYSNVSINVLDITGPNGTMYDTCSFNTTTLPSGSPPFSVPGSNLSLIYEYNTLSGSNNATEVYDNATQLVLPVLAVTFPPANDSRESSISFGNGFMNCLRANTSLPGSRVAPPLPAATALRKLPIKLSKGAIAGIVIGAIVVVAAIFWLMVYLCLRRRKAKRANEKLPAAKRKDVELEKARNEEEIKKEAIQPMVNSNQKYEIDGKGGRGELDPGIVNELEGSGVPELEGSRR